MIHAPVEDDAWLTWRYRSSAATHRGTVRALNEDNYVDRPALGLWAVADGAGGHQAGDVASRIVAEKLEAVPAGLDAPDLLTQVRLQVARAHDALWIEATRRGPHAMLVSTIVVLLVRNGHYACLWAGDSRAYLLRGRRLRRLTRDHSLVQELFDAGSISAAEAEHHPAANVITRAVGAEGLELDKVTDRLYPGDRFLLCSDGLFKTVPERILAEVLATDHDDTAERLLSAALDRQADDNITAVTVEVLGDG